jgi:hypothetical protein
MSGWDGGAVGEETVGTWQGRRGGRDGGAVGEATVGTRRGGAAVRMRRRGVAVGRGAGGARQLSGRAARYPDSGFKLGYRRGTWQPGGSGARRLTGGARFQRFSN